jgi:hypothetical protein
MKASCFEAGNFPKPQKKSAEKQQLNRRPARQLCLPNAKAISLGTETRFPH